jgi:single-stranded DNA-specific DHH superfamily exonuclease
MSDIVIRGIDAAKESTGKILIIDDRDADPLTPVQLAEIGKVRTVSGAIINRNDAVYGLRDCGAREDGTHVVVTVDNTYYSKDSRGTLRRLTPKRVVNGNRIKVEPSHGR